MSLAKARKQKGYPKKDTVYMFQFPPIWGLPGSASPFCEKLEVYLRTYKIPYEMIHTVKPEESPIHKLPFVLFNNELLADSSIIIERLNKHFDINPDADYSPVLVSVGHSFQRLLEEHLYFCMGYFRFVDPEYWPATKQAFFGELPPVVRQLVPRFVQGPIKKGLSQQGIGRHGRNEIIEITNDDLRAISDFLGDKNFFLGKTLSTVDFTLFAFMDAIISTPLDVPPKVFIQNRAKNILEYHKRHYNFFWKDFKKTDAHVEEDDIEGVSLDKSDEEKPAIQKENSSVDILKLVSKLQKEGKFTEDEAKGLKKLAMKKDDGLLNAFEAFRLDEAEFVETSKLLCE